jgi:putative MATE family efflux protein
MTTNTHFNTSINALPPHMLSKVAKLALPVAIQSALVAILQLADVLMVSDFGTEAPAAVGIASKWHFVIIMISAGLAQANGILVSQYWGKGDRVSAKTVTNLAMKYGTLLMLPISILITVMSSYIMMIQTTDATVIELGSTYLWYSLPVLVVTHWIIVTESSLRSSGNAMLPLILGSITVFLNIGLNFWLIKGGLGVPPMGVAGAALATTIARILQIIMLYAVLNWQKHWLLTEVALVEAKSFARSFRKLAIPSTSNALLWAFGTLTYQMIFGHLGTTELAVFSMIGPFESLCYSLFFGISVACSVLIGQALGRDEFNQAISMTKFFIKSVIFFGTLIGIGIYFGKFQVLAWLNLDSPELIDMASPALTVLCVLLAVRMLNMIIINGILRAGGENAFCLRMDFIAMWCVGIPLTAYGAFIGQWGFEWVYGLMLTEELVKLALCFNRYLKKTWINNLTLATA